MRLLGHLLGVSQGISECGFGMFWLSSVVSIRYRHEHRHSFQAFGRNCMLSTFASLVQCSDALRRI